MSGGAGAAPLLRPGARVVVTGGDGFLGRPLVARLADLGCQVLVVDDGRVQAAPLAEPREQARVWRDFRCDEALDAVTAFGPDVVFHLAAMHFVPDCDRDPTACLATNVLGTERLLAALRGTAVRALVFCSSAVVYGFADEPRREDDPAEPRHVYAHSKWLGEGLLRGFQRDRPDVRTVAARLFNLVGPGDTAHHVVPEIVDAVLDGRQLTLGNVWPRRDYVHVDDVAAALVTLADGAAEAVEVNVGTGHGRSVSDVLATVTTILGRPALVERDPSRERAVDGHLVADPGRLTATGWRPRWTFEATMRQLLERAAVR